jgi:hypothetical protein
LDRALDAQTELITGKLAASPTFQADVAALLGGYQPPAGRKIYIHLNTTTDVHYVVPEPPNTNLDILADAAETAVAAMDCAC